MRRVYLNEDLVKVDAILGVRKASNSVIRIAKISNEATLELH